MSIFICAVISLFSFFAILFAICAEFWESIVSIILLSINNFTVSLSEKGVKIINFSFIPACLKVIASWTEATAKNVMPFLDKKLVSSTIPRPYAFPFTTAMIV